ncbi:hypothetical protein DES53_11621 [Roseimicrobium gellanilyticum]|uniref:Uncharacterized protein n=1 Tax=Roseimicrobium gellanilyticum TaxID=748857 RepID=A0A366H3M7_9BACT|nr:hypothetical protein [Roseimicrobium gellanilyticum]RBP36582.1 hypothetical protein DES53_11621 [Roseimicrobium gellanilyticum]
MNTAERIVESYFRYCRHCLTIPDVKIPGGNNRQMDLLAWSPKTKTAYHVESTVVPSGRHFNKSKSWKSPLAIFQNKFYGQRKEHQTETSVPAQDDPDFQKVLKTYAKYSFDASNLKRVWVCWHLSDYEVTHDEIITYFEAREVRKELVEIISFRDEIIPALEKAVGTSNYEDDVLRTFSFFAERGKQALTASSHPRA